MSFFGCIFNEYIILYCCGLERETQDEIAKRALNSRTESQSELNDIIINDNDYDDNINKSSTIISFDDYSSEFK